VSNTNGTQAVDRAARLLTEVVHSPGSVTFTELAAATGLAKSTTSRLLLALERNGLVRRDEAGKFRPGEMFVRFAWQGGAEAGLTEVAQAYLDRLGRTTGETVNLGVGRGDMVEQIAQVDSVYLIGATNWLGRPVPLHCTAIGKVLLAYGAAKLPPGRLERRTEHTITSRAALEAELEVVRQRGYAVIDSELEPGLVAVAAPVYRDGGTVVAALSVSGPDNRLTAARVADIARHCVAQASALSAVLGHRPDGPPHPGGPPRSDDAPKVDGTSTPASQRGTVVTGLRSDGARNERLSDEGRSRLQESPGGERDQQREGAR
jgi:IclR family acetate operon transcriptional repressor